jgi:hypothetical protein
MIILERSPPLPWSPKTIPSTQDFERFDRALSGDEVRWVNGVMINVALTNLRGYSVFRFR